MPSVHTMQEEGSGQPPACQSAVWAEEEPSTAHPAYVLPAVPVLLQVHRHLMEDTVNTYITSILFILLSKVSLDRHYLFYERYLTFISSILIQFHILRCQFFVSSCLHIFFSYKHYFRDYVCMCI